MLLPRIRHSIALRLWISSPSLLDTSSHHVHSPFLSLPSPLLSIFQARAASHKAQGSVNSAKDGPGKRLGAKKSGGERVLPRQIIFRQRGTHWHAGENCGLGRDHTIYALTSGIVRYYKDPRRHPTRKYIGVVFQPDQNLPLPLNAASRRRFGLVPVPMLRRTEARVGEGEMIMPSASSAAEGGSSSSSSSTTTLTASTTSNALPMSSSNTNSKTKKSTPRRRTADLTLKEGYMFREANWEIGRVAEREGHVNRVKPFKPRDRFAAWRKRTARRNKGAKARVGSGRGR